MTYLDLKHESRRCILVFLNVMKYTFLCCTRCLIHCIIGNGKREFPFFPPSTPCRTQSILNVIGSCNSTTQYDNIQSLRHHICKIKQCDLSYPTELISKSATFLYSQALNPFYTDIKIWVSSNIPEGHPLLSYHVVYTALEGGTLIQLILEDHLLFELSAW